MPIRPPKGCIDESDPRVARFGHPAPAWLFPYADLMTELVCFFVILYALSAALDPDVQAAKQEVEQMMQEEGIAGDVKVDKDGMHITLEERGKMAHFESGYADLTPTMIDVLEKLAPTLRKLADKNHDIVVEGHTDSQKIKNEFFWSNWELSTSRATTVVEHLITEESLPANRMAAIGYGPHRPVCEERTRECRARNRRVVFLVRNVPLGSKKKDKKKKAEH